ncbi:MAG: hypothetical protein ACRDFQ_10310 [Anaerolineales bacterium]
MNSKSLWYAAGIAGVAVGFASGIPIISALNCLFCAWLWVGGAAGVWLYNKREGKSLDGGQGALLGALTGLIAAVVAVGLGFAFNAMGMGAQSAFDPEMMEDYLGGLAVTGLLAGIGLLFNLIVFPIFGALGGLIGASLFKQK